MKTEPEAAGPDEWPGPTESPGTDGSFENPVLVVALDAALREAAFDRLCAAGYRVDAVAEARAARQRLDKDRYRVLVVEEDLPGAGELTGGTGAGELTGGTEPARGAVGVPVLWIAPSDLEPPGALEASLRALLEGETPPQEG